MHHSGYREKKIMTTLDSEEEQIEANNSPEFMKEKAVQLLKETRTGRINMSGRRFCPASSTAVETVSFSLDLTNATTKTVPMLLSIHQGQWCTE